MKTAISIPDSVFAKAERARKARKLSRSEFYARAIERFVEELATRPSVTDMTDAEISAALDRAHGKRRGKLDPVVETLQARALAEEW